MNERVGSNLSIEERRTAFDQAYSGEKIDSVKSQGPGEEVRVTSYILSLKSETGGVKRLSDFLLDAALVGEEVYATLPVQRYSGYAENMIVLKRRT